jgi:peptidoglycan/LPS O-acetylase OafA/YrhL
MKGISGAAEPSPSAPANVAWSGPAHQGRERRDDIQAMRALAILLVLGQHFGLGPDGGFLGVDIFFVISGYLMAGIIDAGLKTGRFRIGSFYAGRARRLLPAAAATLLACALIAPWLLDPFELRAFVVQLVGAATFASNIVLWFQTDYFGSGAALKPLLHMWSLAVEEQFYLLLPPAMIVLPRRWWLPVTALATLASLALCLFLQPRSPSATFYFLPTRAWELGIGCVAALLVRRGVVRSKAMPVARGVALALIIALTTQAEGAAHPGIPALIACLATAVLLVPGLGAFPGWTRPLIWTGDRSYSLYLVHWPLLAFAANLYLTPLPLWLRCVLLVVSFVWAAVQYRMLEQRFRHAALVRPRPACLAVLAVLVVLTVVPYAIRRTDAALIAVRTANMGLGYACTDRDHFTVRRECATSDKPHVMVWGDSFAMHLVDGLADTEPRGLVQATRWICGPLLGLAPVNAAYPPAWARGCLDWNASVIATLKAGQGPDIVVLSSIFTQYVPGAEPGWSALIANGSNMAEVPLDQERLLSALSATVDAIRAHGKRVVLVAPPPASDFDIGRCLVRRAAGLPLIAPRPDCRFTYDDYVQGHRAVRAFIAEVQRRSIVPVIAFEDTLCADRLCRTQAGGAILYRDEAHLSIIGSRWLARTMRWNELVDRRAR